MFDLICIVLFVIGLVIFFVCSSIIDKEVDRHKEQLNSEHKRLMASVEEYAKKQHEDLEKIFESKASAFSYVSGLAADYLTWDYYFVEDLLGRGYKPERIRALKIHEMHESTKQLLAEYKTASYELANLLQLFPELEKYIDIDTSKDVSPTIQSPHHIFEKDFQFNNAASTDNAFLDENERNQLILDNYIESHSKTKWQIGRDYEMYIGYCFSKKGFQVKQVGISDKLEDLGRDIIAYKNGIHYIIQCKYWSANKLIHEKHIAQLYGTSVCYALEEKLDMSSVKPILCTNIELSETARRFADALSIKSIEHLEMGEYPRIKCKVNYDKDGFKTYIYHLPVDQQYDSTKINPSKGDMYAFSVEEAVNHGFRRAYRWHNT